TTEGDLGASSPANVRPRGSTDGEFETEKSFVLDLAVRAGQLLVERSGRVGPIDFKSAKDVVTEVDHLSEELILGAIREMFPGDALLAEETCGHVAASGPEVTSGLGRAL